LQLAMKISSGLMATKSVLMFHATGKKGGPYSYVSVTSLIYSRAFSLTGDAVNHVLTSSSVLFPNPPTGVVRKKH
jgi:hypothetical protein